MSETDIILLDTMLTYPGWMTEHQLFGYVYVYHAFRFKHGIPCKTLEEKMQAKAFTFNRAFLNFKRKIRKLHPTLSIVWKQESPLILYKLEKKSAPNPSC